MKSFLGQYASSLHEARDATILVFDKELHLGYRLENGTVHTEIWHLTELEANYQPSTQESQIHKLENRRELILIAGKDAAAAIQELQEEQRKPWHKKSSSRLWVKGFTVLSVFLIVLLALYFLLVPWLSEKLATRVPVSTEAEFGEAVFSGLQMEGQVDTAASFVANEFFGSMAINTDYDIRISVVKGEVINAFALPGGRIVVYDALLKKMASYPELAALLTHEFTHVNNKHTTKSLFRKLGSRIFLGLLFGNLGSVTGVLADRADELKSLTYSRKLEKEADIEGLSILMQRKIEPEGFARLFRHLKEGTTTSALPEFLGSHPDIDRRIEYIREKANNASFEEDPVLNDLFEILKQKIQQ